MHDGYQLHIQKAIYKSPGLQYVDNSRYGRCRQALMIEPDKAVEEVTPAGRRGG
jgi:hypothetical protein